MPIAAALAAFKAAIAQADSLIANGHQLNSAGMPILPEIDRRQITVAAFLNIFIAWETFLEECLARLLSGSPPIMGGAVNKIASPPTPEIARALIIGTQRYFDYANHHNFRKLVELYFVNGAPFQPHINSVYSSLDDLRTMRNACAHISSTTQAALDALAVRVLGAPVSKIHIYDLLTTTDPRSASGETVLETYKNQLIVTAELIANG